jgi:hypothetical protein
MEPDTMARRRNCCPEYSPLLHSFSHIKTSAFHLTTASVNAESAPTGNMVQTVGESA